MKAAAILVVVAVALPAVARARSEPPVAVSPGSASGAVIPAPCPTFSWGGTERAEFYELVVYRGHEEGDAEPVLVERVSGSASSWTPSLGRCLEPGASYAWSVRASGADRTPEWSEPLLFQVAAGPSEEQFREALAVVEEYLTRRASNAAEPAAEKAAGEEAPLDEPTPSAAATAPLEAPAVVSLVTEGAIGVGTSAPQADLHVVGSAAGGGLLIAPDKATDGGSSEILLAEDDDGSFGMKLRYDGEADALVFLGRNTTDLGPWLTLQRDTGAAVFAGTLSGDGSGLANLDPAQLTAGTAGIDISGNAATATTADVATNATTATTATALAADGIDCPSGEVPLGVDAAGNAQGCAPAVAAVSCPPGQVVSGFDAAGAPVCAPLPGPQTLSTVDATGDVGRYTSITVGADGLPVVSYMDYTNLDLKVAKCNDPACVPAVNGPETLSTVDATGDVGYSTSLTLGADGLPVVSYYDATSGDLKVAKCNDPACDPAVNGPETLSIVDATGDVGRYASITLGADGLPVVSYWDRTNSDLKVAKCDDPACDPAVNGPETLSIVDATGNVGYSTSLTLGADGLPVVSYHDVTNDDLKVAKCNDPACVP